MLSLDLYASAGVGVLVSGLCGFGLGATPNAMANMSAVCYKYGVITLFLNLIR